MPKQAEEAILVELARERISRAFGNLGVILRTPDKPDSLALGGGARFDLSFEAKEPDYPRRLLIEVKSAFPSKQLSRLRRVFRDASAADPANVPILFLPRIGPQKKEELRKAHINHADLEGTLSIRQPGLWIELASKDPPVEWRPKPGRVNPFSDKASLVLRVLLREPGHIWKVGELAKEAHVTKGWVSIVGKALAELGYVDRQAAGLELVDAVRILHDWTLAYNWRRNRIRSYFCPLQFSEIMARLQDYHPSSRRDFALTLLAGSSLIAPHVQHDQVHLYVAPIAFEKMESFAKRRLFVEPAKGAANFNLLIPYYEVSAFFDMESVEGVSVVSPLQLYLDLFDYPLRGREAADIVLRTRLARALHLSSSEISRLL